MIELSLEIKQALKVLGLRHKIDSMAQCSDSNPFNGGLFGCLKCNVIGIALKKQEKRAKKVAPIA